MRYKVSVSCFFDAPTPEDAVRDMVVWLTDSAYLSGYRVEWEDVVPVSDRHVDFKVFSVFIDAETLDFMTPIVEDFDG